MSLRPQSTRRLPSSDSYLLAKERAINLLAQLPLFLVSNSTQQCEGRLRQVIQMVERCEQLQRGEVYLLCCQAMVQLTEDNLGDIMPFQFAKCIQAYLLSLIQQPSHKGSKPNIKESYTGRLKKSSQLPQQHRRKLLDWLLVDRIDRALKAIAEDQNFKGFSKPLRQALAKSIKLANTLLLKEQLQEFKENVQYVISFKTKTQANRQQSLQRERQSMAIGKFIIIDESLGTHRQTNLSMRKTSSTKLMGFRTGRYMDVPSVLLESVQSIRREQRKQSVQRSSKRGSLSSNCSKRSSKSEQRIGKRNSTRWGSKINAEIVSSAFNKNRPFRRSNFQQIRHKDFQMPSEEFGFTRIHSIIEEEGNHEKNMQMTLHNLFVDGFLKSQRKMKPFYLFFRTRHRNIVAVVEEMKELDGFPLPISSQEETFRIRIRLFDPLQSLIFLCFPQLQIGSTTKELACLGVLRQAQFYQDQLRVIRGNYVQKRGDEQVLREWGYFDGIVQNLQTIREAERGVLMGFVRKISTYFVCVCIYNRRDLNGHYEQALRNKMLLEGRRLNTAISIQRQLKSTDLTTNFSQEGATSVRAGSVINYIQQEEEDQDVRNVRIEEGFRTRVVQNIAKEITEALFRVIWCNKAIEHSMEKNRQRRNRIGNSRIQKYSDQRKLKRNNLNKNSIKMAHLTDLEAMAFTEVDPFRTHQAQNRSNYSKKDISHQKAQKERNPPRPTKRVKPVRQNHFIESIRTEKGYQLILHKQNMQIQGRIYETYFGHKERNPKKCCYYKDPPRQTREEEQRQRQQKKENYLRASLTIHGQGGRHIQNRQLISFTKLVHCEQGFGGYVVSSIKLLPNCANNQIFIEAYWQARQKYFLFIVSAELFQRLTDINTKHFEEKPFILSEQQSSKKRDKRTSVVASLLREREADMLKQSSNSRLRKMRHHDDSVRELQDESLFKRKFEGRTITSHQMQTMGRVIKTADTCSTNRNLKSSFRNQLPGIKREVVLRLRSKIVKYASFCWRKGVLVLQLKYSLPTQLDSANMVEFQGHEVAMKSVHAKADDPSQLQVTQLVLLRYAEPSLANLGFCSLQGTSQIHLQHVFIKSFPDLYGRFCSTLSLRELIDNHRMGIGHNITNRFFQPKLQAQFSTPNGRIQSRNSYGEEQRKLKYQEIIALARSCALPYSQLLRKKAMLRKRRFMIPDRYSLFPQEHLLLQLQLGDEEIIVRSLGGDVLRTISLERLEKLDGNVRKWPWKTLARIITTRILKDEDIMQICADQHQSG